MAFFGSVHFVYAIPHPVSVEHDFGELMNWVRQYQGYCPVAIE